MSVEECAHAAPLLIDFPMPNNLSDIEERQYVNPVLLLDPHESLRGEALPIASEKIDELLHQLAKNAQDRDWTLTKLVWLHQRDKFNQRQSERLGELLWDGVDASGVPDIAGFFSFVCIELPHPADIDPRKRVKKRLRTTIDELPEGSSVNEVLNEIRNSVGLVEWYRAEALEVVTKLLRWWNRYKPQLKLRMPLSPARNMKRTAWNAVIALSAVFSQLLADNHRDASVDELLEFLADLAENNIPTMELEAATLTVVPDFRSQVTERVAAAMFDKDRDVVVDALRAAGILVRRSAQEETRCDLAQMTTMLVQGVHWRHRPALAARLSVIADLVKNQPWFLSQETLAALLAGLIEIAEESSSGVKGNDQDGVIVIRASAASLAFALFEYYQESGSGEPEAIGRWREICSDSDEFSEVRNSWMEFRN